jgi:hypothetical protein
MVRGFTSLRETLSADKPEAHELLSHATRLMSQAYADLLEKDATLGQDSLQKATSRRHSVLGRLHGSMGQGAATEIVSPSIVQAWFADTARIDLENELRATLAREWATLLSRVEAIFDNG